MNRESAQERADRIKARREAEAREDTFDARPGLTLIPSTPCGHTQGAWVCVSIAHPTTVGHYFIKEPR